MELLGTHVPISWSALLVLLCGVLLGHSVGGWLATSLGWHRRASVAAWIALSTVLALTVTPDGAWSTGQDHCSLDYVAQVLSEPLRASGGIGGGLLNLLLFLPLGTALVVASGRAAIAVTMVLVLPVAIEVAQRSIPGRLCSISDSLANTAGGMLGVIIGVLALLWQSSLSTVDTMK
jgi:glycopeptide antibiotics resistance protein